MKNKSFTLIELLVVIVIIGILASVIILSVNSSIEKANFAKAQAFSNTVQNELLLNLVSEWTFDNPSNIGEDTWGHKDAVIYNASYESDCFSKGCLKFSTMDDYAISSLSYNNLHNFTLSAWINPSKVGSDFSPIVGTIYGNNGRSMLVVAGYKIKFHDYDNGISSDENVIKSNQWQYIVATYDNGSIKLYYNGSQVGSGVYTKVDSNYSTIIGRVLSISDTYNRRFQGNIDDVRIYNNALSISQIKEQYIVGLNSLLANNNISKEECNQRIEKMSFSN